MADISLTTKNHLQLFVNLSNTSFNMSLIEEDYVPHHLRPETYIVPILFTLIFIVGVLGNGTLVYIFLRNKNLRNVPNTYIISLSVGDLLLIVVTVPFVGSVYLLESWPYGEVICKFSEFVREISVGVSVFTLTALSADRYFAIVNPMRKHVGSGAGSSTVKVAIGIWVLSIILAVPTALSSATLTYYIEQIDDDIFVCNPYPDTLGDLYPQVSVLLKFLIYYAMPLVIITSFYSLMARHLLISSQNFPGETQQQQHRQIEARKKVAKMVLSFVIMFAICFFPNHVFLLWFYYNPHALEEYDDYWHALRIVGFCLSFINSCINPIALYCVSRLFRKYYNHYLFCCIGRRQTRRHKRENNSTMINFESTVRRTSTTISVLHTATV